MKEAALAYARAGFPITPLQGQRPLTKATKNVDRVKLLWSQWPDANIGFEFGFKTKVSALVIDPYDGGLKSLKAVIREYGPVPNTVQAEALVGIDIFFFRYHASFFIPERFRQGLEAKNNGCIILPPALYISPTRYFWKDGRALGTIPLAELPQVFIRIGRC